MGIRKRNIALQVFSADDMSNQAALRGKNKANGRFPAPRALISVIRSKNDKNSSEAVDHPLKHLHFTEHAPLWASYLQHPGPSDGNVSDMRGGRAGFHKSQFLLFLGNHVSEQENSLK